jgi:exosortase
MGLANHKQFLVWLVLAVIAWCPALGALVSVGIADENYSYTLLVLGVSVVLLCLEPWPLPSKQNLSLPVLCLSLLALAAAAWLNFRTPFRGGDFTLTISILLWIVFLLAVFVQIYGWPSFSRLRFPWLFSLLAVPPPARATSSLVTMLQWRSADAAYLLFRLFRVPVVRDGIVFSFSKIDIEVAAECSGIRSSTILVVTTIVLAQLFLKSTRSKWIAVLLSFPIAVFKNGVRIFTLSVLGEYVSTTWLDSWVHHQGGVVFLALGLAMMLVVLWLLWRTERQPVITGR